MTKVLLSRMIPRWLDQRMAFSPERTDAPSCAVVNGIPKSGTHLIDSIARCLGKWKTVGVFVGTKGDCTGAPSFANRRLPHHVAVKKLRNGQMIAGHFPWSEEVERAVAATRPNRRVKHVFIYRDPRDTFVSYMNEKTYRDYNVPSMRGSQHTTRFMVEGFSDDDERLSYIIKLRGSRVFWPFARWLDSPHCLPIRFEDLYPEILAAKHGNLGTVLRELFTYLDVPPSTVDVVEFYGEVWGKSETATKIVNKIGQYKTAFKDQHYTLIDNAGFREVLSTFGYEW